MASEDPAKYEAPLAPAPAKAPERENYFVIGVALRVLLFAATLVCVIVMATAKQTESVTPPGIPFTVKVKAKFTYSPAFIYFIAALSVACLYSIITTLASLSVVSKPASAKLFLLYFAFWDVVMLGIVASATGASGAVAYIGLKGNSHSRWTKVCNVYDKYCRHIGSATGVSLFAAILLLLLSMLSSYSLYSRIRD